MRSLQACSPCISWTPLCFTAGCCSTPVVTPSWCSPRPVRVCSPWSQVSPLLHPYLGCINRPCVLPRPFPRESCPRPNPWTIQPSEILGFARPPLSAELPSLPPCCCSFVSLNASYSDQVTTLFVMLLMLSRTTYRLVREVNFRFGIATVRTILLLTLLSYHLLSIRT